MSAASLPASPAATAEPATARAKALRLDEMTDERQPLTSERNRAERDAAVKALVSLATKWRLSTRDFAVVAEVSKSAIDLVLARKRPMTVESILMLPDDRAVEVLQALTMHVLERKKARGVVGDARGLGWG